MISVLGKRTLVVAYLSSLLRYPSAGDHRCVVSFVEYAAGGRSPLCRFLPSDRNRRRPAMQPSLAGRGQCKPAPRSSPNAAPARLRSPTSGSHFRIRSAFRGTSRVAATESMKRPIYSSSIVLRGQDDHVRTVAWLRLLPRDGGHLLFELRISDHQKPPRLQSKTARREQQTLLDSGPCVRSD